MVTTDISKDIQFVNRLFALAISETRKISTKLLRYEDGEELTDAVANTEFAVLKTERRLQELFAEIEKLNKEKANAYKRKVQDLQEELKEIQNWMYRYENKFYNNKEKYEEALKSNLFSVMAKRKREIEDFLGL